MTREKMKPKYELEDYIYDVESRSVEADPQDLYSLLQQKDKDLVLAAELGKALLEKNEQLSKQNEHLAEDYANKLEVLEQERHLLRRKLAAAQTELETKAADHQAEVAELQRRLQEREAASRLQEKERSVLLQELQDQNIRLHTQIKQAGQMEEDLRTQLQSLRDQVSMRKSTFQDHQSSLDLLRDEILMMSDKKVELEKRVSALTGQRDSLSSALDEAADRIMLLEKQMREQQIQMRVSHTELEELRSAHGSLGERLQALGAVSPTSGQRSLHSEMDCDDLPTTPPGDELHQIKVEVVSIYDRVRAVCHTLRQRSHAAQSETAIRPDITVHQVKVGLLTSVIQELTELLSDVSGDYSTSSVSVTDLEIELHRAQEAVDKMTKEMEAKKDELKRRSEKILELTSQLSCRELELEATKDERDRAVADLKDCTTGSARDEILRKAWEVRDGAVARKNAAQVELARTRIEVMQANSQLIEAIQQKVELSQQLEQWQMDMHALLDEQMRRKLANPVEQGSSSGQSSPASAEKKRTNKLLFGLFNR